VRVGDLEVDDGVDGHREVVLGDHGLRRERHHLLTQVDPGPDPVHERQQEVQPGSGGLLVLAQPFDHGGLRLRDHHHGLDRGDDDRQQDDRDDD
jgi:hypothetical protein